MLSIESPKKRTKYPADNNEQQLAVLSNAVNIKRFNINAGSNNRNESPKRSTSMCEANIKKSFAR